jgi:hypothetical protein
MNSEPAVLILAIEPRHTRFGYALFEAPDRLLDWGASAVAPVLNMRAALQTSRRRVSALLKRSNPMLLVLKRPRRTKTGKTATTGPILKAILHEAVERRLPVHFLNREEIVNAFHVHEAANDEQIAEIIANMFPELLMRLPPKRNRKWQSERRVMVVFGAIATGLAYFQRPEMIATPPTTSYTTPSAFPPAPHELA